MNIKQAAQEIRDTVDMDRILAIYGYRPKHGFLCCPFHGEKAPSLKIYQKTGGWHCFGCGRGGSVIDFVMEHENCDFRTAVIAIDRYLGLGLMDPHENPAAAHQEQRIQAALDNFVGSVYACADAFIHILEIHQRVACKRRQQLLELKEQDVRQLTADDHTFLLAFDDEEQYTDYLIDTFKEYKEEVAEWRRKARRTG